MVAVGAVLVVSTTGCGATTHPTASATRHRREAQPATAPSGRSPRGAPQAKIAAAVSPAETLLSTLAQRCDVPATELRNLADSAVLYEQIHRTRDTRLHVLSVLARSQRGAGCLRRLKLYAEDRVGCGPGRGEMPWMGCDFDLTLAREAAARP
jgi:hypothetical protein